MRLRWLTTLLSIAILSTTAQAQIGIYGKFDALRLNASTVGSPSQAVAWFTGPGAGVYYDFLHHGPVALGADLRGNLLFGKQQKYRSALFGLRLVATPPRLAIRPYIQGSVGAGGARYDVAPISGATNYTYSTKFQYQVLAGLDYNLMRHLDARLAEVGYGRMSGISSNINAADATLFTISAGLVFKIH